MSLSPIHEQLLKVQLAESLNATTSEAVYPSSRRNSLETEEKHITNSNNYAPTVSSALRIQRGTRTDADEKRSQGLRRTPYYRPNTESSGFKLRFYRRGPSGELHCTSSGAQSTSPFSNENIHLMKSPTGSSEADTLVDSNVNVFPQVVTQEQIVASPNFKLHAAIAEHKDRIQQLESQLATFQKRAQDGEARMQQLEQNVQAAIQTITEHLPAVVTQEIVVGQVADLVRNLIPPQPEVAPIQAEADLFALASRNGTASNVATRRKNPLKKSNRKSKTVVRQSEMNAEAAIACSVAAAPALPETQSMVVEPAGHNVSGNVAAESHRSRTSGYEPYRLSSNSTNASFSVLATVPATRSLRLSSKASSLSPAR
ncbi:hypothetical protein CYLTODRAFT_240360 [Cylindrobasidium torrendii FP15055 ss-10]|uniref:Uncharacterized protein n=1 Tax=Cylindrobasidium torrendii FP15055 ss-10 TaxID=1314674 RepID=A0A0D7BSN0_9AGAR|nr:hypothetical protein CYLTODRAFT_240360 [Cylindrobasidium torrendii FP15055 ss-10]